MAVSDDTDTPNTETLDTETPDTESVVTSDKRNARPKLRIRTRVKPGPKTVNTLTESDRADLLSLRVKGVDTRTLATRYEVNERSLNKWLKQYDGLFAEIEGIENFKAHRADLLTAAHSRLLKSIVSESKLKRANLGQVATAMDKVYKHERLERGLSTDNQSVKSFSRVVKTEPEDPV
jgi:hypothetical protein